jgi:hypothetical protein
MKIDHDDIELIQVVHKQYHHAADEKVKQGLRSLLGRNLLRVFLLQVKYYAPWASTAAVAKAKELLHGVPLTAVKLHSCNLKEPAQITDASPKYKRFVNGNKKDKDFHLEHDPPSMYAADEILNNPRITGEEIEKALEPFRICFITREENEELDKKGYHSKVPPSTAKHPGDRYQECGIEAKPLYDEQ